ncbi:hypothetical protein RUND412_005959 [Rhizina undulata]
MFVRRLKIWLWKHIFCRRTPAAEFDLLPLFMLPRRASTVFRIKNIPAKFEVLDLEKILRERLSDEERTNVNITFVPSCYWAQSGTKWALVDFLPIPGFLLNMANDKTESSKFYLQLEDERILTIDINFYGFTQLYDVQKGLEIAADIVAITGLGGYAYGSWRGKHTKKMWLLDFLAEDLPNCRTIIYGYNSNLKSRGVHTIQDYKIEFLNEITEIRKSEEEIKRPVIFIEHSFGGIVIVQSLVDAASNKSQIEAFVGDEYLVAATYAVKFFGNPHRGILMNDVRKMLEDDTQSPRVGLLDEIDNSLNLGPVINEFIKIAEGFKIVLFYERLQTAEVKKVRNYARHELYVSIFK